MITAIRRSFKSKAYKIILWIVLLAVGGVFSVFELAKIIFFGKSTFGQLVLQVNRHKIYEPEFMRSVADQNERLRYMRAQYGQYADLYFQMMGIKANAEALAVNDLIRKALLNDVANQLPFFVSSESAQEKFKDPLFVFQELSDLVPLSTWDPKLGGINPLLLNTYLHRIGISSSDFDHELVQAVKRKDLKSLVEHAAVISNAELKEQFAKNFLAHKFSLLTIPNQDILAQVKKEAITDETLKAYFDLKNAQDKRYYVPEKRSAKVITFDPNQYGITICDEEVEKYYNNNKAQFVEQPAQVQVRRILFSVDNPSQEQSIQQKAEKVREDLLKEPKKFDQKARELSQDSATASQGGLMPYFSKGQHDKTFEKTSFLLKADGDISSVIRTKDGFEIVQRVGKKMQTFKPLAQAAKDIKDALRKKKFTELFASDVRAALAQTNQKEALEKLAREKNGKETLSKDIALDDSILAKTVFRLKNKESSLYQESTQGVVVTLAEVKESYVPELSTIKSTVKEDYHKDQVAKKMSMKLEEIQKMGSKAFENKEGFKIEKTGWLRHSYDYKDDEKEKESLQKKGVDLGKMFQLENIGSVVTYESNGNGYAVRLDEIAPFDQARFDEKKKALSQELEQQRRSMMAAGFVASLHRNATINKNESLIHKES